MSHPREVRIKRLRFRSWHRGIREMDLLLGRFADRHLDGLSEAELGQYEAILEVPDADLLAWLIGATPVPGRFDTDAFRLIRDFKLD